MYIYMKTVTWTQSNTNHAGYGVIQRAKIAHPDEANAETKGGSVRVGQS